MNARGKGFASLTLIDKAIALLLDRIPEVLEPEKISTSKANNRLLAGDIYAPRDLPGFYRAAMDGFAVRAEDTFGASEQNPVQLEIMSTVEIGDQSAPDLELGSAIRISTGAPLPSGATSVVRLEDCEELGNVVEIYIPVSKGKNVSNPDEDVKAGKQVYASGKLLRPWDLAHLESLVIPEIKVVRSPKIGTLSTGNELVDSGELPGIGQVVDSNRPAINAWIEQLGGTVAKTEHCKDNPETIRDALRRLAQDVDLIITTGGTSVGTKDYLAEVISELGELWVHGVAIRPGKPVALGSVDNCPIIALPGYPLAAFINFHLLVVPVLTRWTGLPATWRKTVRVKLAQQVPSSSGMRDFVRLRRGSDGAETIRITGAGILSSLVQADYMLVIPEDVEGYNAGDMVDVLLLGDQNE